MIEYVSVVVPVYNEEESILECYQRLSDVLVTIGIEYELIFVNDGSTDQSIIILNSIASRDMHVTLIDLSRNFGKEIAVTAGLDVANGAATVVIDADLQDPPELISAMISEWRTGTDVVYAQRTDRIGESWFKKATSHVFYRLLHGIKSVSIPRDVGDYRLLSKRAVMALRKFREHHRFMKGLFASIGFPQKVILFQRDARFAGKTKWNYWRLWNFALEGITSFTTLPLRISSYLGIAVALVSMIYGMVVLVRTLMYGNPVAGYPSLLIAILFLGGLQLIAIGVVGEYLGRVFNETKMRPLYFISSYKISSVVEEVNSNLNSTTLQTVSENRQEPS